MHYQFGWPPRFSSCWAMLLTTVERKPGALGWHFVFCGWCHVVSHPQQMNIISNVVLYPWSEWPLFKQAPCYTEKRVQDWFEEKKVDLASRFSSCQLYCANMRGAEQVSPIHGLQNISDTYQTLGGLVESMPWWVSRLLIQMEAYLKHFMLRVIEFHNDEITSN